LLIALSSAGGNGIYFHNSDGEIDNLTSSNNKENGIAANRSRIRVEDSVISGNEEDGINLYQASSLELRSSTISSNSDGIAGEENSTIKVRDSTISNNSDRGIKFEEGSVLVIKDSTISGVSGKQAILGDNKAVLMIEEDSGSTVISTTNNDAIYLRNRSGEIGDGVVVSSTGTNNAKGIQVDIVSSINIQKGATVNGTQSGGSIVGTIRATIEIAHGSTVS